MEEKEIMMKRKTIYQIIGVLLLLPFVACQDYLEKNPDSSLDVPIDSEEKIAELLTGAYPQASYCSFLETRTDNVAMRQNGVHSSLNEAMYFWIDYDQEDLDTPLNYWNACYAGIAQANKALELLASYPKTERVKALYGEAFLLRAYLHFMLVNIWAAPYRGEDSKKDLGIPYLTKPEKNALVSYKRGNVYDVYQKIEKDLKLGISLVNDKYYAVPKFHFNKKAAYAFASRYYLFKGEWQLVIDYANYVLTSPRPVLRNWYAYRKELGYGNNKRLWKKYLSKEEPANLMFGTSESRIARELPEQLYGTTRNLLNKIYNTASPFHIFSKSPKPIVDGVYQAKFNELALWGDTSSKPRDLYVTNVLFSTDEVALNRIEAYTMLGDYEQAVSEIKRYFKNKFNVNLTASQEVKLITTNDKNYLIYSPFYGLTIVQLALVQNITNFRRQEFLHEGLRWFDIRRFYMPVNRTKFPLRKDDPRKLVQLPIEAIKRGLEANPR